MSSSRLQAACLSIGLVSAWAPTVDAAQTEIAFDAQLGSDVVFARVLTGVGGLGSGNPGGGVVFSVPDFIPGSGDRRHTVAMDRSELGDSFAMVALIPGSGFFDLVLTSPGLTLIWDVQFEVAFPGFSEQVIVDSLMSGVPDAADAFLRANFNLLRQSYGLSASATAFSAGVPYGSIIVTATAVPAPGAALAVIPLFALPLRRRRRAA